MRTLTRIAERMFWSVRLQVHGWGVILASLVALVLLSACADSKPMLALQGRTMGTSYSVQLVADSRQLDTQALKSRIHATLEAINAQMSTYDPNSELSRFNQSETTDWFAVPAALAQVIAEAKRVSDLSNGAFDVTVGRLVNLWGFGPEFHPDQAPTPEAIAQTLALTGDDQLAVRLDPPAVRKRQPELYVDLSAIAKGYAVDQLAGVLDDAGVKNYLVEIGGELRARGQHPQRPWRVAIERPESSGRALFRVVPLRDLAMATSGDYRNFFEQDGVFYSHTIDPATGRPVKHRLASVSVLDAQAMRADALATALLVLGPQAGLALAEIHDIAAFFIERLDDGDYRAQMTPAFERLTEAPAPASF